MALGVSKKQFKQPDILPSCAAAGTEHLLSCPYSALLGAGFQQLKPGLFPSTPPFIKGPTLPAMYSNSWMSTFPLAGYPSVFRRTAGVTGDKGRILMQLMYTGKSTFSASPSV